MSERRYRVFVLGAGFSRRAGLPLGNELWEEIRRRARHRGETHLEEDVQTYTRFRRHCDGVSLTPARVDFEEFVAFLDMQHVLRLRGTDTWSDDGNESQITIKSLIGEILMDATPPERAIPDLYLRFAKELRPHDYVLTFNYDVLLERAMDAAGRRYRLFPQVMKNVNQGGGEVVSADDVVLLKLHGSVDWFDRTSHDKVNALRAERGFGPDTSHPVFSRPEASGLEPLTHGERFPDDPLRRVFRARNVDQVYARGLGRVSPPLLLAPSTTKMLYSRMLVGFYDGLSQAGHFNFGLNVIGYSLPPHDHHARQILYFLTRNYQSRYWGAPPLGPGTPIKQPMVVVDCRSSTASVAELKSRYAFVNWRRTTLHTVGFDEEALRLIAAAPRRPRAPVRARSTSSP